MNAGPKRSGVRRMAKLPKRAALELLRRLDPVRYARAVGVKVGEHCKLISTNFGSEPYLITLGNRVEVTAGVRFITHDGGVWVFRDEVPSVDVFGPIVVEDHAFIGVNAVIMPGVRIGPRALVAAGAVVTRDVAAGQIVAGTPAKVIGEVDDYKRRAMTKSLGTKGLGADQKRRVLERHFAREPGLGDDED